MVHYGGGQSSGHFRWQGITKRNLGNSFLESVKLRSLGIKIWAKKQNVCYIGSGVQSSQPGGLHGETQPRQREGVGIICAVVAASAEYQLEALFLFSQSLGYLRVGE